MPDLIFTIKTPAELEGAERAAHALEVSIGKAKGLSKEYAALETQLKSVQTSIEAFKAAQSQTATAPAEATKKAADETERYAKALEAMDKAAHEARAEQVQQQLDLQNAMKGTSEGLDEAGKKTKLFAGHSHELKKLIGELSREFPIAGLALRAFASPIGATLTVAVGLFVAVKRHIQETNAALDDMATRNAQPLSDFAEAFRNATNEANSSTGKFVDYIKQLGDGVSAIKTDADAAVAAIRRLEVAQLEISRAQEAKALAEVNFSEELGPKKGGINAAQAISQRQQIREFFSKQRDTVATATENAAIKEREKELAGLRSSVPGLETAAQADNPRQKAKIKTLSDESVAARAEAKELEEKEIKLAEEKSSAARDKLSRASELDRRFGVSPELDTPFEKSAKRGVATAEAEESDLKRRRDQLIKFANARDKQASDEQAIANAAKQAAEQLENLTKTIAEKDRELKALKESSALGRATRKTIDKEESETRSLESKTEALKAKEKAEREEEQRKRKEEQLRREAGQAADREITSPQASLDTVKAGFAEVGVTVGTLTTTIVGLVSDLNRQLADANSKIQDANLS